MKPVKVFLTDVDGCMTDGGMYYTESGDEFKRFCVYDGMGIVLLRKAGIPCGILTSENTETRQETGIRVCIYRCGSCSGWREDDQVGCGERGLQGTRYNTRRSLLCWR